MDEARAEREARWRDWMAAAQGGDAAAYEKLLRELLPELRGFVRRRLFRSSEVEDVVQNVLLSVHRARHTFRPERRFAPWLHAIARNAVVDHIRARGRRTAREVSLEAEGVPEPAVPPEHPEPGFSPRLAAALEQLSPKQRQAVTLIHLEGLSVAAAAERAGVTRTALKVRAHRGYRALRALLGDGEHG